MTNEELIKALRYCGQERDVIDCADCARRMIENGVDVDCEGRLLRDAADALEAAEKRIAELEAQLPKLPDRQEFLAKGSFIEEPLSRPKEGEWIQMNGHRYCNVCGHKDSPILTHYCPNCGCAMKGANDERH